jgi:hypothetical protein
MRSLKAFAFAFGFGIFAMLQLSGCGGSGSGSTTGTGSTPPPTVTVSANPISITAGQSSTLTITTNAATSCTGTDSLAGTTVPLNATGTVTVTPTATSTYGVSCTGTGGNKNVSVTVTVTAVPATITSVSVVANPVSITTAQTSVCTATVDGTGAFSSAVAWTATGGTIVDNGADTATLTPSGVGTASCIANSAQAGYTTVSGSASIAVTQAPPTIMSISPNVVYLDGQGEATLTVNGTGFTGGDNINITAPGSLLAVNLISATQLQVTVKLERVFYSPGWFGFTVCEADGTTCSATMNYAFIGNQNTLAIGPDGTLYQNDQAQGNVGGANGYIRKFTVFNGVATATGSFLIGLEANNPVDNKTGYDVGGTSTDNTNGTIVSLAASDGETGTIAGQDANNGLSCFTTPNGSPTANLLSCFTVGVKNAQLYDVTLGTEPWTVALATLSGTTNAYTYSRKGSVMVWKNSATTASLIGSYAPVGFTDFAAIPSGSYGGGWEIVVFQNQGDPLSGTMAILSNYDKILIFVNAVTMAQIGQPIALTGNPFRIAKDETNGKVVIEFADLTNPANPKSTFASVTPSATTPVTYDSTSPNLGAGFAVSPDGKYLYVCQRASCDVQPNK